MLRKFIRDHKFEETLFPRIPVPIQKDMVKKLEEHDRMFKLDLQAQGIYTEPQNDGGPEDYEPLDRNRDRPRDGPRDR